MILADKATTIAGYYKRVLYFSQCWAAAMMDKFKLMFKEDRCKKNKSCFQFAFLRALSRFNKRNFKWFGI